MKQKLQTILSITTLVAVVLCCIFCFNFNTIAQAATGETRYTGYASTVPYDLTTTTETVTFTRREESYVETYKGVPRYREISGVSNACGPIAGAMIVGFYDRYYEDLIPEYTTYVSSGTYKGNDTVYIPQLIRELYSLMRTNVDDVGVNETDCLNGLKLYVEGKGRSISYSNIKSINKVNETSLIKSINNNVPVLLFCSKSDMYAISSGTNDDLIVKSSMAGAHIVVGYGLYTINYYNGNTLFRTDKYIRVATGLSSTSSTYFKLSATDWCNSAYSVEIS